MAGRLMKGSTYQPPYDPFAAPPSFDSFNSPLHIAEYLAALLKHDPFNVEAIAAVPLSDDEEQRQLVETDVWVFEQLRRLAQDQSIWIAKLSKECTRETCPEMRANDWLYLCAAHASPPENGCCAIDYMTHTLDGSVALLNSTRYFASRLTVPQGSLRFLPAISRRLYRSFAHAFFHHRSLFELLESSTSLYQRFLALNANFDLIESSLLVIPVTSSEEEAEITGDDDKGAAEGGGSGKGSPTEEPREEVP